MTIETKCFVCTAKKLSPLGKLNANHRDDCVCYFCICPKCKSKEIDQEMWVSETGSKVPINKLPNNDVTRILNTMNYSYNEALTKMKKEGFFDKKVLDTITKLGPSTIFAQYDRIDAEFKSRNLKVVRPNSNIDLIELAKFLDKNKCLKKDDDNVK